MKKTTVIFKAQSEFLYTQLSMFCYNLKAPITNDAKNWNRIALNY